MIAVKFISENGALAFRLSTRDSKVSCSRQFPHLKKLVDFVASEVRGAKEPKDVDRVVVLELALKAERELRESNGAECYDYQFNMPPANTWIGRGQSGFKVNDRFSGVHAGPGTLFISCSEPSLNIAPMDVRGLSKFVTDSGTEIGFRKKRRESNLPKSVHDLLEMLRNNVGMPVKICQERQGAET